MKYAKGDILTSNNGQLYQIKTCHKDNTFTLITFFTQKYHNRYTQDELEKYFSKSEE